MKILISILMLSLLGMMISCGEHDDVTPGERLNKFRVKEITGKNDLWGSFKMNVEYQEELVDKAWVVGAANDTVGRLNAYAVLIKVPALTEDEIAALPEGSTVPTTWKSIFSVEKTLKEETVTRTKYKGNQLMTTSKETYLFEYDDTLSVDRKIVKWRKFEGIENDVDICRMIYRYEGNSLVSGEYDLYERSRWEPFQHWTYTYNGGQLTSIVAKTEQGQPVLDKKFVYSGNQVKVTVKTGQETREITYTLNTDGYVTRMDEGNGNFMEIKYEAGHGNFSDFTPEVIKLQGEPYIK